SVRRPDLGIPATADAIVLRALEVDPGRRWPDFDTMARAMEMIPDWPGAGVDMGPSEVTPMLPHPSIDAWSGQIQKEAGEAASAPLGGGPPIEAAAPSAPAPAPAPADAPAPDFRRPRRWPAVVVVAGVIAGATALALSRSAPAPADGPVADIPLARP